MDELKNLVPIAIPEQGNRLRCLAYLENLLRALHTRDRTSSDAVVRETIDALLKSFYSHPKGRFFTFYEVVTKIAVYGYIPRGNLPQFPLSCDPYYKALSFSSEHLLLFISDRSEPQHLWHVLGKPVDSLYRYVLFKCNQSYLDASVAQLFTQSVKVCVDRALSKTSARPLQSTTSAKIPTQFSRVTPQRPIDIKNRAPPPDDHHRNPSRAAPHTQADTKAIKRERDDEDDEPIFLKEECITPRFKRWRPSNSPAVSGTGAPGFTTGQESLHRQKKKLKQEKREFEDMKEQHALEMKQAREHVKKELKEVEENMYVESTLAIPRRRRRAP